jgi:hypothetical protein
MPTLTRRRDPYIREKFTKEQSFARQHAKEYFAKYPKDQTEIESWRELQSRNIDEAVAGAAEFGRLTGSFKSKMSSSFESMRQDVFRFKICSSSTLKAAWMGPIEGLVFQESAQAGMLTLTLHISDAAELRLAISTRSED